jgi:hypothetical protein
MESHERYEEDSERVSADYADDADFLTEPPNPRKIRELEENIRRLQGA